MLNIRVIMEEARADYQVDILSPRNRVKAIKTILESQHKLDKSRKISPSQEDDGATFIIPTTCPWPLTRSALAELIGDDDAQNVRLAQASAQSTPSSGGKNEPSPLRRAARDWLTEFQREGTCAAQAIDVDDLVHALPTGYSVYAPMLLLPSTTFVSPGWQGFLGALSDAQRTKFYAHLAHALQATHVALNAPIPPLVPDHQPSAAGPTTMTTTTPSAAPNTRRSPAYLTPLHGDFGPAPPLPAPSAADLGAALWVTARQHGVWQTWAPRHVMFARGNVGEKARVQRLVRAQLDGGGGAEVAAVDLYAGIGYFAFAYAAGGAAAVLCWEVNAWSVEGMRRGAAMNGWAVETVREGEEDAGDEALAARVKGRRLVAFHASNEGAAPVVARVRGAVPPVRHVNCGLLPSSRPSWRTAVAVLDPLLGGWVHVHENLAEPSIALLAEEIVAEFRRIVQEMSEAGKISVGRVQLDHMERVKTYAPGVMHCVLDISILA
jgi:tRNA wybutosine-synthesizing protein 2